MHPFCWLWGPISIYPALRCCFANASIVAGNVAVCWYLGIFPMEVDCKPLLSLFSLSDLGILWTFHPDCWLQFWWWTRHQVIVQNLQALHPQSSVPGHHSISDPHCRFGSFTFIACNPPFWTLVFNHNPKTCKEDVSGSELGSRRIESLKHGATPSLIFCSSLIFSNSSEHTLTARGATGTINRHRLRNLQFSWDVHWVFIIENWHFFSLWFHVISAWWSSSFGGEQLMHWSTGWVAKPIRPKLANLMTWTYHVSPANTWISLEKHELWSSKTLKQCHFGVDQTTINKATGKKRHGWNEGMLFFTITAKRKALFSRMSH